MEDIASQRIWIWLYISPSISTMGSIRHFQKNGVQLLKEYDNKKGVKCAWQSIDSISIKSPLGGMTVGNNPTTDRSKLGQAKRYILTDKNGIPISVDISSANSHEIKAVTYVIDNAIVLNRHSKLSFTKKKTRRQQLHQQQQHLCLDRAYSSKSIKNEIIKRGYVPHIPYKRKRG